VNNLLDCVGRFVDRGIYEGQDTYGRSEGLCECSDRRLFGLVRVYRVYALRGINRCIGHRDIDGVQALLHICTIPTESTKFPAPHKQPK